MRFIRWERQLRLYDRELEILRERGIENQTRTVPPKLALPIVEYASLEEDDELQDLWARLLASALDPAFKGEIRSAFIDIIRQLSVTDVHILDAIYKQMLDGNVEDLEGYLSAVLIGPTRIVSILNIELVAYESSIDNLLRLRLVSSNVGYQRHSSSESYAGAKGDLPNYRDYDLVCLTPLGLGLLSACTDQRQ